MYFYISVRISWIELFDRIVMNSNVFAIAFAIFDISFIGSFLGGMMLSKGATIQFVGLMFALRKCTVLLTDIPFGLIADEFGVKAVMLFARLSRITSVLILLLFNSKIAFALSAIMYGMSMSGMYGKIDSYLYLHAKQKNTSFEGAISWYYTMANFALVMCGFTSTILFKYISYSGLAKLTILISSLSLILWFLIQETGRKTHQYVSRSWIQFLLTKRLALLKNTKAIMSIISIATMNAIIWQSNGPIALSMLSMKIPPPIISLLTTIHFAFYGLGYFSISYIKKNLLLKKYIKRMFYIFSILLAISIPLTNIVTWGIFCILTFIWPSISTDTEISLLSMSNNKDNVATTISLATFFSSLIGIIATFCIGIVTPIIPPNMLIETIYAPIIIVAILSSLFSHKK